MEKVVRDNTQPSCWRQLAHIDSDERGVEGEGEEGEGRGVRRRERHTRSRKEGGNNSTEWQRCAGCHIFIDIFIGHVLHKSPMISGSFAERNQQLEAVALLRGSSATQWLFCGKGVALLRKLTRNNYWLCHN